ncbi:MAG TPA: DUF4097 family beta strand repeat-containing protein [Candidatus Dormibacteraeota bacterium]|jgi:DUF4097 and DUF4098 domain-containing protein YvlB
MAAPLHTFDTPEAISVDLSVEFGGARIIASDRSTTVVAVRPLSEGRRADVEAAERTRVQFAGGRLEVRTTRTRGLALFIKPGAVEVVIQLPTGSHVKASTAYGDFDAEGRLGDCFFKTSYGTVHVEDAAALTLQTSAGNITAGRIAGIAEIKCSSGDIRVAATSAAATIKASAGDIRVESAGAALNARTAYGAISVGRATGGRLDLAASYGDVEVGVAGGIATLLDLQSNHGRVRNELDRVDGAQPGDFLEVHAVTGYGDIRVHRA